jgi:P-type E1-E2 ATPase
VKYIFSDKTGTLTRNVMDFKKCTIAEHIYTLEETPSETQLVKVMFAMWPSWQIVAFFNTNIFTPKLK